MEDQISRGPQGINSPILMEKLYFAANTGSRLTIIITTEALIFLYFSDYFLDSLCLTVRAQPRVSPNWVRSRVRLPVITAPTLSGPNTGEQGEILGPEILHHRTQ